MKVEINNNNPIEIIEVEGRARLGDWISGSKYKNMVTGKIVPSIRYGRSHIGIFYLGKGAQTYIHSDYFNINKNLLWHTLEWLITPERPSGKDATATYYVIKDHLGSTRVLFRSTGSQYTTYDYSPFGTLMRSSINGDTDYRFTGQEYDSETGLWNFRARLYDDELGIFYAVDPSEQNFSPFAYCGNNPVLYIDKDGRFWFLPIIVGALFSGATYSISAAVQGNWTWSGFGTAVGLGALGGGISGGLGAIGGSLANNAAYNMLTNSIGYAATTAVSGGDITFAGVAGMITGGLVGGAIPGYTASGTSTLGNIFGELVHESFTGFVRGSIGGAVTETLSGADFGGIMNAFGQGGLQGAKLGAINAAAMISIFGPAFDPNNDNDPWTKSGLNEMESDMALVGNDFGSYSPVYRRGGLFDLVQQAIGSRRGLAFGRNLFVPKTSEDHLRYTTLHETWHYYQMINAGWANLLGNSLLYGDYWVPGNSEWAANQAAFIYGGFYGR